MTGINYKGSYIHTFDASMGMNIVSNNESNIIGFRFISSMILSEIEGYALSLTGIQVNSSLTNIFNYITNNETFSVIKNGSKIIITL